MLSAIDRRDMLDHASQCGRLAAEITRLAEVHRTGVPVVASNAKHWAREAVRYARAARR